MVSETSLANLKPGNRNGVRHRITRAYTEKLTDFLMDDFDAFIGELQSLPPRDRVAAKLKLMDMIIPKKQELEVENIETPKWEIRRAQDRPKGQIEDVAHEVMEEAPVAEETPEAPQLPDPVMLAAERVLAMRYPEAQPPVPREVTPEPEATLVTEEAADEPAPLVPTINRGPRSGR